MKHYLNVCDIKGNEVAPVDVITFGSPCFPKGTLVSTMDGYKPIEEISVGDVVLSHQGTWETVVDAKYTGHKQCLKLKAMGLEEIIATPNHQFYIRKANGEIGWCPLDEVTVDDYVGVPEIKIELNPLEITPAEAWLIGRYIADGYIRDGQRPNRPEGSCYHQTVFCIGDDKRDEFESHLNTYKFGKSQSNNCTKYIICDTRLFGLCKLCGKGAINKCIPPILLNLPKHILSELIWGYISGDGSLVDGKYTANSISRNLIYSVGQAVVKALNVPYSIYKTEVSPTTEIEGRTVNQHPYYSIRFKLSHSDRDQAFYDSGYVWLPVRELCAEQKYPVYDLTVANKHSFCVFNIAVHNCQDLSLAGKRKGLKHSNLGDEETTRSGLFMEAIRIIEEMRKATNNTKPRYAIYENVAGCYSSNDGADFQTVLTALSNVKDPNIEIPMPLNNHWDSAGYVQGDSFSIAWRTLDAQYWGVPQRRRRIFMVADFDGNSAFDIMFNSEYDKNVVQRTSPYSDKDSTIGFDTYNIQLTGSVGKTLQAEGGGSGVNEGCMLTKSNSEMSSHSLFCIDQGLAKSACNITDQLAPTLSTTHQGEPVVCAPKSPAYSMTTGYFSSVQEESTPTLLSRDFKDPTIVCYGICSYDSNSFKSDNPHSGVYVADTARTLDLNGGNPACNQGGIAIVSSEHSANKPILYQDKVGCLAACDYKWPQNQQVEDHKFIVEETTATNYVVRRLTPLECCRLQGMPDGWTHLNPVEDMSDADLAFWNSAIRTKAEIDGKMSKPKTKQQIIDWYNKLQTDGAEYKAYGNGMALPCVLVPITGIAQSGAKTMASLFDGIGGFPLAGRMNGIECLWTSEIELFPIAVTKQNFG